MREGIAILLVEQNVVQSLEVAQRAYILDNGRVRATGKRCRHPQRSRISSAPISGCDHGRDHG